MSRISFCKLTEAEYNSLSSPDPGTVFFLTDSKKIILGGNTYIHELKSDRFMVNRTFADDTYGTVTWLDENNQMDFSGYFAEPVSKIELWIVSANPAVTGNIALKIGTQYFIVPVTGSVQKVVLLPETSLTGRISIVRETTNITDTLNDGTDVITAMVVDWRCS